MSLRATAERVTDRVEDRLEPVRETAAERIDDAGDRLRGAVRSAPDVSDLVSERSRDAADSVERYLEERFGEETLETWAPRLAFAVGGLVIGFLIGWTVRRNRRSRHEQEDEGFAQAPRTAPGSDERPFQAVRNN